MNIPVELTVEQALEELREMFPDSRSILVTVEWAYQKFTFEIEVAGAIAVQEDSLSEAMEQVRRWKQEQS